MHIYLAENINLIIVKELSLYQLSKFIIFEL